MQTASAIGDDRLQSRSQGYVVPDAFTPRLVGTTGTLVHDRAKVGQVADCDTFQLPNP
jgi:uncharacterized protein